MQCELLDAVPQVEHKMQSSEVGDGLTLHLLKVR